MKIFASFSALFVTALGLVFVMPQSPISVTHLFLDIDAPTSLAQGSQFVGGGQQGLPNDAPIRNPFPSDPITDPLEFSTNSSSGFEGAVNTQSAGPGSANPSSGAQTGGNPGTILENPLKVRSVQEFIAVLLGELVKVGYVIGVCFIVYAGFKFVTGGESDSERTKAKNMLLWTVIGIGILLGAQAIALIVSSTIQAISNSAQ